MMVVNCIENTGNKILKKSELMLESKERFQ
jgi:hypothetical protein